MCQCFVLRCKLIRDLINLLWKAGPVEREVVGKEKEKDGAMGQVVLLFFLWEEGEKRESGWEGNRFIALVRGVDNAARITVGFN